MPRLGRSRPASNYKLIRSLNPLFLGTTVGLTAPNLALAAPSPTLIYGNIVALTAPNLALAAPSLAPAIGPTLTTPNLLFGAPPMVPFQTLQLNPQPLIPIPIAGFGYEQADFIELWTNPAAFFQQRVIFRASQTTTATTLPSAATITTIVFDNIIEDPYDGWAAITANEWTAPFAGWYQVSLTVWVAAPGATNTVLLTYVQSQKTPGNVANSKALTGTVLPNAVGGGVATWVVYLAAGDAVFGAAAISNSGSNVSTNLTAGQNSTMEIIWLSS